MVDLWGIRKQAICETGTTPRILQTDNEIFNGLDSTYKLRKEFFISDFARIRLYWNNQLIWLTYEFKY
jgi:hypothetical protein